MARGSRLRVTPGVVRLVVALLLASTVCLAQPPVQQQQQAVSSPPQQQQQGPPSQQPQQQQGSPPQQQPPAAQQAPPQSSSASSSSPSTSPGTTTLPAQSSAPPQMAASGGGSGGSSGDAAVPPIKVCMRPYPPFVLPRVWQGSTYTQLLSPTGFSDPYPISGVMYGVSNSTSTLDGFDVALVKLTLAGFNQQDVTFLPYPDLVSMLVGLVNHDCDMAIGAVKLDTPQVKCPDPGNAGMARNIAAYPGNQSGTQAYSGRWVNISCVDFGLPYYTSGYAIMSVPVATTVSVLDSLTSPSVVNVVTIIMTGVFGFAFLILAAERGAPSDESSGLGSMETAVYASYVTAASSGLSDVSPGTGLGRVLMTAWLTFGILAMIALSSIVSSNLVLTGLADNGINSLSQLDPNQVCIDSTDVLLANYLSTAFGIPMVNGTVGNIVMATNAACFDQLASGAVAAVVADKTVLDWVSLNLYSSSQFDVSDVIYEQYLTWAFPSNSMSRPSSQVALLTTFTNTTWISARDRLEASWFVPSNNAAGVGTDPVYMPTVWSMVALGGAVIAWCLAQRAREYMRARRASQAARATHDADDAAAAVAQPVRDLAEEVARVAARAAEVQARMQECWASDLKGGDQVIGCLWRTQGAALVGVTHRSAALSEELMQLSDGLGATVRMAHQQRAKGAEADAHSVRADV